MKKCVNCGYEGEEILICPKCGGNMEHTESMADEMHESFPEEPTQENHASEPEKKGYLNTPIKRKQYWITALAAWIGGSIVVSLLLQMLLGRTGQIIFAVALIVFWIILQIKRLKDADKSPAWLLLNLLTPFIALIVIGCFPSAKDNQE